jgi:hypothetical protein
MHHGFYFFHFHDAMGIGRHKHGTKHHSLIKMNTGSGVYMGQDGINFFSFSFVLITFILSLYHLAAPHALVFGIRRLGRASIVLQAERVGHLRGISGINERNVERVRSENHIILHNTWMYST